MLDFIMITQILTWAMSNGLPECRQGFRFATLFALSLCLINPMSVNAQDDRTDLVLFQQTDQATMEPLDQLGGLPVRMLNSAHDGRQVAVAELPGRWRFQLANTRSHSVEWLVLEGYIEWEGQSLGKHDFAYLPGSAPAPVISTGDEGAKILLFLDPPRTTDGNKARLVISKETPWRPGVVAQQDTGTALKLEVKDLLWVESTGQRTWLLRAGSDLTVPWEVHDGAEEGYLLDGEYRLGECLADGPIVGSYAAGGYFYRPGGIVHSGPESGTPSSALWLLRTPTRLTVEFLDACP